MANMLRRDSEPPPPLNDMPMFDPPSGQSKLTPATVLRLRQAMQQGHYLSVAARYAGVSPGTVNDWKARGEDDLRLGVVTPYSILCEQISMAEMECEAFLLASAMKGAVTDGRLALEILGRKNPDRWGRKDFRQISGQVDVVAELRRMVGAGTPNEAEGEILIGPDSRTYNPGADGVGTGGLRSLPPGAAGTGSDGRRTASDGGAAARGQEQPLNIE